MKAIFKTIFVGVCVSLAVSNSSYSQKIAKCQDENGKWHYGSSNLHRCADSQDITTLNDRGILLNKEKRVKTGEELAIEKAQKEQLSMELEKQRKAQLERDRILTVYQNEQDIETARQKKLIAIDRKIGQHKNYIAALDKQQVAFEKKKTEAKNVAIQAGFQAKIEEVEPKKQVSEQRIKELKLEKTATNKKYDEDLAYFKKHK